MDSRDQVSVSKSVICWYSLTCSIGVFVETEGCWNLINNLGDLNDIQAFSPECPHLNMDSEEEFGFWQLQFLVALHIHRVFDDNQLHSSWELDWELRLLWLDPTRRCGEEALDHNRGPGSQGSRGDRGQQRGSGFTSFGLVSIHGDSLQ